MSYQKQWRNFLKVLLATLQFHNMRLAAKYDLCTNFCNLLQLLKAVSAQLAIWLPDDSSLF